MLRNWERPVVLIPCADQKDRGLWDENVFDIFDRCMRTHACSHCTDSVIVGIRKMLQIQIVFLCCLPSKVLMDVKEKRVVCSEAIQGEGGPSNAE